MESSPWRKDRWFVAEGQMFEMCTTSHAGLMRVEFPDNISLLIKSANNILGMAFFLRKESSQQRFSIWERQARLLWWLRGKHPKPKGSPVEAAVCVRKCRRPSQAEGRSGWENSQSRAGQPTAGKSAEKRCHQTLASRGLPFSSKPKEGECFQIHDPQHLTAEPGREAPCGSRCSHSCIFANTRRRQRPAQASTRAIAL